VKGKITTNEGAEEEVKIYFYCTVHTGKISASVSSINTTMIKGQSRDYMFDITNTGLGETGIITLALPTSGWMTAVTPTEMASLASGESATIVLRLTPTDDMQLNVPVTGNIGINCENGSGMALSYRITPVSVSTGSLTVDVCDEFTYYTDEKPHVSGASVTIKDISTGAALYQGTTGSDGTYYIESLPEGYYTLNVGEANHDSYTSTILVDPGVDNKVTVNLSYQSIKVTWEVVETEVEDEYEIVTTVTYETSVPQPYVEMDVPSSIDAASLGAGESLIFYAVLTNRGLITAQDCELGMPEGFKVFEFTPMIEGPFDLAPQQSVTIPIKVTNTSSSSANVREAVSLFKSDEEDDNENPNQNIK